MGWLGAVAVLLSVINTISIFVSRGTRPSREKVDKHESRLIDHDRRIQSIEGDLKHLPAKAEVHTLNVAMARLEGHFGEVRVGMEAMQMTINRIERSLHEDGK